MSHTVLIVEDDAQMMSVMAEILKRAGHDVIEQPVLEDALADLEARTDVDVVLLDIWHDGRPAFDALDAIKARDPLLKILVVSGGGGYLSTEASIAIAELSRTDAVLLKPFSRSSLLSEISRLFA